MKLYDPLTATIVAVAVVLIFGQFFDDQDAENCTSFVVFGKNMQVNCESSDENEPTKIEQGENEVQNIQVP